MIKRIPYSLYKTGYTEFKAFNYDRKTKTIEVELPNYKKIKFPKEWRKDGNNYFTPNNCVVTFWNTGLAENFYIEHHDETLRTVHKTIDPALNAREQVIAFVNQF